jgi:hypothetical protein
MNVFGRPIEPLLFWWKLGVVIAFLFLIGSIAWLIFQGVLICQAYAEGDLAYIDWKFWRYAFIAVVYFTLGGFLRLVRFI